MVTIERLEIAEYGKLTTIQEGFCPEPEHSIVVVGKSGDEIVARTMLIRPFHVEGTWIAEPFRNGTIGIRLLRRLEEEARAAGLTKMLAYAAEDKVENYLGRMGYKKARLTVW